MAQTDKGSAMDASFVSSFELAGCEWLVQMSNDITEYGHCNIDQHVIRLRSGMSDQLQSLTFYHELVHAILMTMGKMEHSEEFVENFGNLLYQFMKTVKNIEYGYEEDTHS